MRPERYRDLRRNGLDRHACAWGEADGDGNPRTTGDPGWTPLETTPPIPDHDSAHAVQGGAAAAVNTVPRGGKAIAIDAVNGVKINDATVTTADIDATLRFLNDHERMMEILLKSSE